MNTPPRKERVATGSTRLSSEDKERLIENLDIEGQRAVRARMAICLSELSCEPSTTL